MLQKLVNLLGKSVLWPVVSIMLFYLFLAQIGVSHAEEINVEIEIKEVWSYGKMDSSCCADIYSIVTIDGKKWISSKYVDTPHIEPVDWKFPWTVDSTKGTVPIKIEVFDDDGQYDCRKETINCPPNTICGCSLGHNADDALDILDDVGKAVDGTVDLQNKTITLCDYTRGCYATYPSGGEVTSESAVLADDRAKIRFSVWVGPPDLLTSDNLAVECFHEPIWPSPGDQVVITARARNITGTGFFTADRLEIYVNDREVPKTRAERVSDNTYSFVPEGDKFAYRCVAHHPRGEDHRPISSGWRTSVVGYSHITQSYDDYIPVLLNGSRNDRIDIVFHPDTRYTDAGSQWSLTDFYREVGNQISQGFFGTPRNTSTGQAVNRGIILEHQDRFNFWISLKGGEADEIGLDVCLPNLDWGWLPDWIYEAEADWVDLGFIVHPNQARDCSYTIADYFSVTKIATAEAGNYTVALHETGHGIFGLSDEYWPTYDVDGSINNPNLYFMNPPYPNIYDSWQTCRNEASLVGNDPDTCGTTVPGFPCALWPIQINLAYPLSFDFDWRMIYTDICYTSDSSGPPYERPGRDDLMFSSGTPRALDRRRMEWVFCGYAQSQFPCGLME
jgi:hypothetical protein